MDAFNHNIRRSIINPPIGKTSDAYINGEPDEMFNDEYYGIVVSNSDQDKIGRCQIRVYGLFSDTIKDDELPWAIPDMNFIGSKIGSFVVPPVDTIVKVHFSHGDIYHPVYCSKGLKENSLPSTKGTDYPDNMVLYATDQGEYFSVNRKTKKTILHHSSGTEASIDTDGNVLIDTNGSSSGKVTINVKGDAMVDVKGNVTVKSLGDALIQATKSAKIKSLAVSIDTLTLTVEGKAGTVTPNASGGPFNCLIIDPTTGATHQGNVSINPGQGV
jgi:hypothetical protein